MKRRSFLAMLGLAPVAGVAAHKGLTALTEPIADGSFRVTSEASRNGYAISARAAGGEWRSASMFLDVPADTGCTRVVIEADKFIIS